LGQDGDGIGAIVSYTGGECETAIRSYGGIIYELDFYVVPVGQLALVLRKKSKFRI
jgi:hypothetical protein